jgi:hypothetical protein
MQCNAVQDPKEMESVCMLAFQKGKTFFEGKKAGTTMLEIQ